jgi:hypothetical protein
MRRKWCCTILAKDKLPVVRSLSFAVHAIIASTMTTQTMPQQSATAQRLAGFALSEVRAWVAALTAPVLYITLAALALWLLLLPQLPLWYSFDVGYEEGYDSDLPMLAGFNTAESDELGTYRWTTDGATIRLPGLGRRPLQVELHFLPVVGAFAEISPTTTEVYAHGELLAVLPTRLAGSRQQILVPARLVENGTLELTLGTETFTPPGDPRQLGLRLDRVVVSAGSPGPALPAWQPFLLWLLTVGLSWATLLRTRGELPAARLVARLLLGLAALLIGLAALFDPPRWAFGGGAALSAVALSYLLVLLLRAGLPPLARRLEIALRPATLGWLLLIVVLAFGLRIGGRFYPNSMHGDIGFHANRFNDMAYGLIFILSTNRGVDFPYPPGSYLLLAPTILTGLPIPAMLQIAAELADALGALLVYTITVAALAGPGNANRQAQQVGVLAAALYAFSAAGFMTTWWSFNTHIYTQFAAVLLVAALMLFGRRQLQNVPETPRRSLLLPALIIGLLLSIVFLGHFGFLINISLFAALLVGLSWLAAWRGAAWAHRIRLPLTLALAGATMLVSLFFYTAYMDLFRGQLQTAASGGLPAVADRAPISRDRLWDTFWQVGMITHFGFFPLPLALLTSYDLLRRPAADGSNRLHPARLLAVMMIGSFAIGAVFAVLPFITLATNSPRWLMTSAWAICIGAASAELRLWRRGWAGRLASLAIAGYLVWNSALIWFGPMLFRIRPPEPF